jgi:predicted Mrr-cat superfamily restriction endonuclease
MPFFLYVCVPLETWGQKKKQMEQEQSYWMHRCKCGDKAWPFTHGLLLNHNLISIGWSYFSNPEQQALLTKDWDSFEKVFNDAGWGQPRNRYNLWRFLNKMKKGDVVVVPLSGSFNVYRIADDVVFNNQDKSVQDLWIDWNGDKATLDSKGYPAYPDGQQIDMGFYRKVEPLTVGIPRGDYASQALYSRMKIQQTNCDINDLREDVKDAVARYAENRPINLRSIFTEDASKTLLNHIRTLLKDQSLEKLVAWYMQQLGAETTIPAKNSTTHEEGDADVIATFDRLNGFTVFIQAKKHTDYTNEWAVTQITNYKKTIERWRQLPSSQLWVISTCDDFSEQAKRDAEASNVRLIAGQEFAQMLVENGVYYLPL